jgi:hypothetical protein
VSRLDSSACFFVGPSDWEGSRNRDARFYSFSNEALLISDSGLTMDLEEAVFSVPPDRYLYVQIIPW